jgi:hypothetical protein
MSTGVATVAYPASVEPYMLNRISPNSSMNAPARLGDMAEPLTATTLRLEVSNRRRTAGGRSMIRRSIVGTAMSTWQCSRSIRASVAFGSKRRVTTTVLLRSIVRSTLSQPQA